MSATIIVTLIQGKDLSEQYIKIMNAARLEEFGSTVAIDPKEENEDWTKLYFLLTNNEILLAFGRLHEVTVTFDQKKYEIFGIATVVSLEKNKGHGKILVGRMREYIEKTGKTAVGFCHERTTPFYEKCGFKILIDGQKRFYHPTPARFEGSDVIYIAGSDGLIETILENPHKIATISRPHW